MERIKYSDYKLDMLQYLLTTPLAIQVMWNSHVAGVSPSVARSPSSSSSSQKKKSVVTASTSSLKPVTAIAALLSSPVPGGEFVLRVDIFSHKL
jgi:hypothetical protein